MYGFGSDQNPRDPDQCTYDCFPASIGVITYLFFAVCNHKEQIKEVCEKVVCVCERESDIVDVCNTV